MYTIMASRIYKAKRKNWKELPKEKWWVEGAIFEGKENSYVITNVKVTDEWEDSEIGADVIGYLVDPSTICQDVGMTDKNERKIFEGDIICFYHSRIKQGEDEQSFMPEYEEYSRNYSVEFVNTYHTYGLRARNKSIHFKLSQATVNTHNAEVIGNIFDNTDLIGGGEEFIP